MTWFSTSRESQAIVAAPRSDIWALLSDPDAIARMTPLLNRIEADGDQWIWHLAEIDVLGKTFSTVFTETMTFDEGERIDFAHTPRDDHDEKAGAEGTYLLKDADGGTDLSIRLEVKADLPLPKVSAPAVHTAMKAVLATMGTGFAKRLNAELGID